MIVKPRAVPGFMSKPDPAVRAILVYGPDEGLVRERIELLMTSVVDDLRDPFRVADLNASDLSNDPALLADEAAAIAMGGGRRVIRVRGAGNEHAALFESFLDDPLGDALVVVEGSKLTKSAGLKKVFEQAKNGAALACYSDEGADLENLIIDHLRDRHGLGADGGAVAYLAERLGSDRMLTRQELDKLALYIGADRARNEDGSDSGRTVTLEDAEAAVGDSGAVQVDQIVFAAAGGDLPGLDRALSRYLTAGENPIPVLRALATHLERLQLVRAATDQGQSLPDALKSLRPPVFFKQQTAFTRQARLWPRDMLKTALQITLDAEGDCKTTGLPADTICGRALLRIATAAHGRAAA